MKLKNIIFGIILGASVAHTFAEQFFIDTTSGDLITIDARNGVTVGEMKQMLANGRNTNTMRLIVDGRPAQDSVKLHPHSTIALYSKSPSASY